MNREVKSELLECGELVTLEWVAPPEDADDSESATSPTPPLMRLDAMPCSPSSLRTGEDGGTYLTFRPQGYANPIELPVITSGTRDGTGSWTWNGSLEKPTLRPSIKSWHQDGTISHLWLNDGMCEYLSDSTDGLAGLSLPLFLLENA